MLFLCQHELLPSLDILYHIFEQSFVALKRGQLLHVVPHGAWEEIRPWVCAVRVDLEVCRKQPRESVFQEVAVDLQFLLFPLLGQDMSLRLEVRFLLTRSAC